MARRTKDCEHTLRQRAVAMVLEGFRRDVTAYVQGVARPTLATRPKGGSACRLEEQQLEAVRGWMEEGPDLERDGLTRWRVADIAARIEREFGVKYTVEGVRRLLRRLGFRHVSARTVHPKAAAQEAAAEQPVEIWFQDEARIGQKCILERVWATKNTRPPIVRDHRYGYCYLYGAACAARREAVGLVVPKANTEWMNEHLAAISAAMSEGALDGAGWHKSGDLVVPGNLRLLVLPPYSPEPNPMEQVFQYLNANRFANQVFATVAEVQAACAKAWAWLCSTPERIASILEREWVAALAS